MTAYQITASATDSNGTMITSNTPETLGEAYSVTYLTREAAEAVAADLAAYIPEGYEFSVLEITELEITELEEGELYDVASVAAVMQPLPDGYNVGDFFRNGRYLGADADGVGVSI